MVAGGTSGPGMGGAGIDELHARCEICLDMLSKFARIHLEVDTPTRRIPADEPDWIGRLRKVCLHVLAITGWEFSADVEHVMATELRAAYVQMGAVWKCVPEKFKLDEIDGGWWTDEARSGMLATYDHPTPQSLLLPAGYGGFRNTEDHISYAWLAVWLGKLGLGYGVALAYLAEVLGSEGNIASRVTAVMHGVFQTDVADVRAAEAAFQRGKIAATQIRWDEAATHFDKAARLDPTYVHLNEAGIFAERAARHKTALRNFEELLKLSRREYGDRSPKTATVFNNLASVLQATGRYAEAEPLHRQALEIRRKALGEAHPDYATSLHNLAGVLQATGKYAEAESLYRQALEICRKALGEVHPDYAMDLNNLASVLQATGRYAEAEPLHRQALGIRRKALGEAHPDYAMDLNNLASLQKATGKYTEAEPLYRQALEICRKALGEAHPSYAVVLNNLAGVLQATSRYAEAEPLYRQALEIRRKALGEEHPDYAISLHNLASLLKATSQYAEAEPLYQQAVEIVRASLGDDHPNTRRLAGNYVRLLRAQFPDHPALAELNAVFGEDVSSN